MKRLVVALCFLLLVAMAVVHAEAKVYVLCFHTFWGNPKYPLDFSQDEFAGIMDQFTKAGFKFVTMDDIFADTPTGTKNILVTIDDGNKSVFDAYHRVLEPRNIKPMLAIIGGSIENIPRDLTWSQLEELQACGCYIAAHGWFHIVADERLYTLSPDLFDQEFTKSRARILKYLPTKPIVVYVYPYGKFISQDDLEAPKFGYLLAFGLDREPLRLPLLGSPQDRYNLPRYIFSHESYQASIDRILQDSQRP